VPRLLQGGPERSRPNHTIGFTSITCHAQMMLNIPRSHQTHNSMTSLQTKGADSLQGLVRLRVSIQLPLSIVASPLMPPSPLPY